MLQEKKFDEIAAAGTAAVITPVRSVTYHVNETETTKVEIGNGKTAGPAFIELMTNLTGIHSGDVEDTFGWLWPKEGITRQ
jgi:branched-chain amino acid aminotransferase